MSNIPIVRVSVVILYTCLTNFIDFEQICLLLSTLLALSYGLLITETIPDIKYSIREQMNHWQLFM